MAISPGLYVLDKPGERDGAPLVVMVHGTMDRASSFGRVARRLRDLHVVRFDRRGYGRSRSLDPAPIGTHAEDLLSIVAGRPAVVLGHSIGALVALAAAGCDAATVRGVLAFEPPTPWEPWWPAPASPAVDAGDQAEAFMRRAVGDRVWQRLPAATRADRRAEGEALRADLVSASGSPLPVPASVSAPVIVGVGSETTWWHRRAADELVATMPAAALAVVDGAQHGAHLTHPHRLAELVRRLVEGGSDGDGDGDGDEEVRR